jgi:hypothetical protein
MIPLPALPTALYVLLSLAGCLSAQQQQTGGYLAAVFQGDVPHVFLNLAPASAPSTFTPLNDGNAVLVPTSGTGGARDPFIVKAQDSSEVSNNAKAFSRQYADITAHQLIVLATDLDIGKTDWGTAQTNGSRSVLVWRSSDGVTWSTDRLVELMPPTAGYVSLLPTQRDRRLTTAGLGPFSDLGRGYLFLCRVLELSRLLR